jgi:hypothetical protein
MAGWRFGFLRMQGKDIQANQDCGYEKKTSHELKFLQDAAVARDANSHRQKSR